jgi:hypothetical protein
MWLSLILVIRETEINIFSISILNYFFFNKIYMEHLMVRITSESIYISVFDIVVIIMICGRGLRT